MHPSRHLASMMGYATSAEHNMVVMTAAQGKRHQVTNIGLSIKRCAYEGPSVQQWAQSLAHKVPRYFPYMVYTEKFLLIWCFSLSADTKRDPNAI